MATRRAWGWATALVAPLLVAVAVPTGERHAVVAGGLLLLVTAAAATQGGRAAGMVAGALSAVIAVYSFTGDRLGFGIAGVVDWVSVVVFPAAGYLIGALAEAVAAATEAERRAAARLVRLQRVTEALANVVESRDVTLAVDHACRELGAVRGTLSVVDHKAGTLSFVGAVGVEAEIMARWATYPLDAQLPASEAARTGETLVIPSRAERNRRYPAIADLPPHEDHALVCVPAVVAGRSIGVLTLTFAEPRAFDRDELLFLGSIGDQCAQALERARLFRVATEARDRAAYVAEVTTALSSTLDVGEIIDRFVDELVPRVADGALVDLVIESGTRLTARRAVDEAACDALAAAVATNDPEDEVIAPCSARVPLVGQQGTLGSLTLAMSPASGRSFLAADIDFMKGVSSRAAVVIDNALAHGRAVAHADLLQRSLLPVRDPAIAGLDVAVHYRAVGSGLVGGDTFDVVPLTDDRWLVLIGDVSGKGVEAAATTALLRFSVRALARVDPDPAAVLAGVNSVMLDASLGERFATAVVALVEVGADDVVVDVACAGHPLPLLRHADGCVCAVGTSSGALGLFPDTTFTSERVELGRGDLLLLYTDGLVEARDSEGRFSAELVERTFAATAPLDARSMVATLAAVVAGFERDSRDDVAMVAIARPAENQPLFPVTVRGLEPATVIAADAYLSALAREALLVESTSATAPNVLPLVGELLDRYAGVRATARRQAEEALARGESTVDLHLELPAFAAGAARELRAVIDETVPMLAGAKMLTLPPKPAVVATIGAVLDAVDHLRDDGPPAVARIEAAPALPVAGPGVAAADERCEVELPADRTSPATARALLRGAASAWGFTDCSLAELVLSELVTNAVIHARTPITLAITRVPGGVRLEVADRSADVPVKVRRDLDEITGRGLALVESVSTRCGIEPFDGGKRIWADVPADNAGSGVNT